MNHLPVMHGLSVLGLVLALYVLVLAPHTRWFRKLNHFESTTTLEEILEDHRKDDHDY